MLENIVQNLGDHMLDAVVITEGELTDLPGPRIVWCNKVFCDTLGVSADKIVGQCPRIFEDPRIDPEAIQGILTGLQGKQPFRQELLNYRENGDAIWTDLNIKPVRDEAGQVRYWVVIQRDITDQKHLGERLARAGRQLENCVDAGEIGVWEISSDFSRTAFSDKNFRLLGYEDGTEDLHWVDFWKAAIHPDDRAEVSVALIQALQAEVPIDLTYRIKHLDGSYRWWRTTGHAHRGDDGASMTVSGVNQDVTALREAQDSADKANRLKSEFLANMSHEIRTPLNGVLGMTQLLETTNLDKKQQRYVNRIINAGNTLLGIISDVLDISKIETGVLELEEAEFNIAGLLDQVRDSVRGIAAAKDLEFSIETNVSSDWLAKGDANRIRQILVNLAGNAIKFTDEGCVKVIAEMLGDAVRFEVVDTGPGIPESKQEDIFGRFTQLDGSSTRQHGGTGLGLAIAKDVVELMGGDLKVESEVGQGSKFWFELKLNPFKHADVEALDEGDRANDTAAKGECGESKEIRILAAEDNDLNQFLLKETFGDDASTQLTIVENGAEAIEQASAAPFDLILMDINMSVMTGDEAVRHIRETAGPNQDVPIFVLTANALIENRKSYIACGADDCVIKPINIEQLKTVVFQLQKQPDRERALGAKLGYFGRLLGRSKEEGRGVGYPCALDCQLLLGSDQSSQAQVANFSNDGACIQMPAAQDIPDMLRIRVAGFDLQVLCRLVWQRGQSAQVEFVMAKEGDKAREIAAIVDQIRSASSDEQMQAAE